MRKQETDLWEIFLAVVTMALLIAAAVLVPC